MQWNGKKIYSFKNVKDVKFCTFRCNFKSVGELEGRDSLVFQYVNQSEVPV